jgi:CubicO group peptidase (beta-lactamase class C family)
MTNRRTFIETGSRLAGTSLAVNALAAPLKTSAQKELAADVLNWMTVAPVPGVWITWLERGKVGWEQGFGVKNAETKQAVDAMTMFEAASLTKQVTAFVAHALHSEGKLDFDKPLNEYVDAMTDPRAQTVTTRHVLSHTSGFPNWRSKKGEVLTPDFTPGERFSYSGEGYVYLSRVLEKIADKPFGELVQQRVFDPLGMTNSSLARLQERESQVATGHDRRGRVLDVTNKKRIWEAAKEMGKPITSWRYKDMEASLANAPIPPLPNFMTPNAAASMCTTGPDYAKFVLHAIKNPQLRKQQIAIREGAGWKLGWGLGWGIEQAGGHEYLWQWGDNGGYKNIVMIVPVAETGVFVFTNGDAGMRICDRVVTHATGFEHLAFLWI